MKKKAFTLIELLVVVAIIALLVSILLPALGRARALARNSVCMSNLKGLGSSLALFESESNGMYPKPFYVRGWAPNQRYWYTVLLGKGYLPSTALVWCPSTSLNQPPQLYYDQIDDEGYAPFVPRGATEAIGYGATSYTAIGVNWSTPQGTAVPWNVNKWLPDELDWQVDMKLSGNRSDEVFLFDHIRMTTVLSYEDMLDAMPDDHRDPADGTVGDLAEPYYMYEDIPNQWYGLSIRHGHKTNGLFFDSHVGSIEGEAFWESDPGDSDCMWDGL